MNQELTVNVAGRCTQPRMFKYAFIPLKIEGEDLGQKQRAPPSITATGPFPVSFSW